MAYRNKAVQVVTVDVETKGLPRTDEQRAAYRAELDEELVQEAAKQKRMDTFIKSTALDFEMARIVSIAMVSDFDGETRSKSHTDERELSIWFTEELASMQHEHGLNIRFCGFNILAFDLPMLHLMLNRHKLEMHCRVTKWDTIDLISEPFGKFIGKKPLSYYLRCYGIPAKTHDGSEVAAMWEEDVKNNTNHVEQYNRADVEKEYQLYLQMSKFYEF